MDGQGAVQLHPASPQAYEQQHGVGCPLQARRELHTHPRPQRRPPFLQLQRCEPSASMSPPRSHPPCCTAPPRTPGPTFTTAVQERDHIKAVGVGNLPAVRHLGKGGCGSVELVRVQLPGRTVHLARKTIEKIPRERVLAEGSSQAAAAAFCHHVIVPYSTAYDVATSSGHILMEAAPHGTLYRLNKVCVCGGGGRRAAGAATTAALALCGGGGGGGRGRRGWQHASVGPQQRVQVVGMAGGGVGQQCHGAAMSGFLIHKY